MSNYIEIHNGEYKDELPLINFNFNYPLDHFQLHACKAINNNEHVLITAHTGSGKTVAALEAIKRILLKGKKVIYTSPIKTLSNQKFHEFSEHFDSVGIMTGDIKINPLANLIIMTAEILRNALLRKYDEKLYEWNFNPNEIECVILDEVHYINNPERGHIWEDIILNLQSHVQLIMLSATISKAENIAKWIGELKQKKCHLISTLKRPVPLKHGIWWDGEIKYYLNGDTEWKSNVWNDISIKINKYYKINNFSLNEFFNCIKYLENNKMIPCIIFLLNRLLVEKYAKKIPYHFTDVREQCLIQNIWNEKLHKHKDKYEKTSEWNELYLLVTKGIGIHHSGMIPVLKEIVEILYSLGLVKVLLATETFAMGVNMPTKTVLFFNINKFDGNNFSRNLRPEEYGQMAGRAGRRGLDTIGHVIVLPFKDFIDEQEAKKMILSPPQVITSKFSLNSIYILKNISIINTINTNIELDINIIYSKCVNSLFHYQNNNKNNDIQIEYNDLNLKINNLKNTYNINNEEIIKKIYDINNKLNIYNNNESKIIIKLDKKLEKKLINEKKELLLKINNIDINIINQYFEIKNKMLLINDTMYDNKMLLQINIIINNLKENNYIDNNYNLTACGKIISEINECNPYILHFLYLQFDKLDFSEIVAICSILISEKLEQNIYISDLNCSDQCKVLLNNLNEFINISENNENILNNLLPYPFWLNWNINYTMFNNVKIWAESSNEIKTEIYIGNFIKTMLRIVNIIRNINNIAIVLNNITIINKLEGYQEILIRGIVTTDSLYL